MSPQGIGVDVASVRRIAALLGRRPEFARRVFTPGERADCRGRAERWASRWAAKEAVRKLCGAAGTPGMPAFHDIEVHLLANGAPQVRISGRDHGPIALSLTHEGDLAIAVAVALPCQATVPAPADPPPPVPPKALRLPARPDDAHKGTFGTVVVVAASHGLGGAAYLCSMGAARSGAGLVRLCVPEALQASVAARCVEVMAYGLADSGLGILTGEGVDGLRAEHLAHASVLVLGPGLGDDPGTVGAVAALLGSPLPCPVVVDADGLNIAARAGLSWAVLDRPVVVTPHPAEMARLVGVETSQVQFDRAGTAQRYAEEHGVVVVLKGSHTLVAGPGGRLHQDDHAVVALATGGTGDVLAGVVGGLIACGLDPFDAAVAAVTVHAEAGLAVQARLGRAGALAGDLLDELPPAQERLRRAIERG